LGLQESQPPEPRRVTDRVTQGSAMPEDRDTFSVRETARIVKFNDGVVRGRDKADEEIRQRDDLSGDGTGWKDRRLRFDMTGDEYEETVIDPETGEVVHHETEPLSKHRDHGGAKQKD
jgi:hypothetical protein